MANYYTQSGNYKHTDMTDTDTQANFTRYNFRANVDVDITKDFYIKLDLGAQITDRKAPGTTADRIVALCNTQPSYLPITVPDNGNPENETFVLENPYGLLYGDYKHRRNILGELSRTGSLTEKKTYLNGLLVISWILSRKVYVWKEYFLMMPKKVTGLTVCWATVPMGMRVMQDMQPSSRVRVVTVPII